MKNTGEAHSPVAQTPKQSWSELWNAFPMPTSLHTSNITESLFMAILLIQYMSGYQEKLKGILKGKNRQTNKTHKNKKCNLKRQNKY